MFRDFFRDVFELKWAKGGGGVLVSQPIKT